jgi:hypothetical protein
MNDINQPMEEEFNLSNYIQNVDDFCLAIDVDDVKEFIRRLKEEFMKEDGTGYLSSYFNRDKIIDKLAGEKLT